MSKKIIDKEQIKKFQENREIGSGLEGVCYKLPDTGDILKIYHDDKRPLNVNFDDQKSDYISFPKDVLLDSVSNEIIGITMPFMPGEQIINGFPEELEITKLEEAYAVLLQELEKNCDIYMVDICLDNILFDISSNIFYLIDTVRWNYLPDVAALNRAKIDRNLSTALCLGNLSWLKNYENLKDNRELFDLYSVSINERYCPFLKLLNLVKKVLVEDLGQEVVYISDLTPKSYKKS